MEGGHGAHGGDPPSPEENSAADPLGKALTEKAPRLVWTDSRLRTLLHLRLIACGDQFNKHKSRAQLTVLWSRVALFGQIRADEATTGNLEKAVKYPSYWSVLVEFFADKKGLRNQDFGQSQVPLPPFRAEGSDDEAVVYDRGASGGDNACSEMYDDSSSDEAGDAHAEAVEMEKERHNIMRKRPKLDLPEALVSMGSLIAKAMTVPDSSTDAGAISAQLKEIQETQNKMVQALENSANVNAQLLHFLQSKMG
ncbi:hypothetical protein GN958_ATG16170 [Phytophthora infestans]|uniref:Uncharacterized protein n=1 Tax=Phytophthora infestans TaxID=4787 RepID=A0A8S9U2Z3_PHYIN|nr:hypothetical protein GN958_ATG16170 [Phytophthora infestans]